MLPPWARTATWTSTAQATTAQQDNTARRIDRCMRSSEQSRYREDPSQREHQILDDTCDRAVFRGQVEKSPTQPIGAATRSLCEHREYRISTMVRRPATVSHELNFANRGL
jgi:hypothetical protein